MTLYDHPGPWHYYLKRPDNKGLHIMQIKQKYLQEQLLFEQQLQLNEAQNQQQSIVSNVSSVGSGGGSLSESILQPLALKLTFDDIANANTLVGDASNVDDWNTFFNLPTNGTSFTSVTIAGSEIQLFGGSNIILDGYNNSLFYNVSSILKVIDNIGCIVTITDYVFVDSGLLEIYIPACTYIAAPQDSGVFSYNTTTIHAPNLSNLGVGAFEYCEDLYDLILDFDNITSLDENFIFYECYNLPDSFIDNFVNLTAINGQSCFVRCTSLINPNFQSLTSAANSSFANCLNLISPSFPLLTIAGVGCFSNCTSLTTCNFPLLTTVGDYCFAGCTSLTTIDLPVCINLGSTVGDDAAFQDITGNTITATFNSVLATCDGGNPDGDIQYLDSNNTVTITYV